MRVPPLPAVATQFLRFGIMGTVGYAVDVAVLYLAVALGAGPLLGRVPAYLAAATTTYALNRRFTFGRSGHAGGRGWALFLVLNLGGFALNYGAYALLVHAGTPLAVAVAGGALAGMGLNFSLSRRFVFGARGLA